MICTASGVVLSGMLMALGSPLVTCKSQPKALQNSVASLRLKHWIFFPIKTRGRAF